MRLVLFLAATISLFGKDPWSGNDYHRNSSEQRAAGQKALSYYVLVGNEDVLDIGCGDGFLTSLLAEKAPRGTVLGIDLSPSMIEFAKSHFSSSHVDFRQMDARELDFSEKFDLVTSFTALHWIPDQIAVLKGVYRALKSGGRLAIEMPNSLPESLEISISLAIHDVRWSHFFLGFTTGQSYFTPTEYKSLLDEANLKLVTIEQFYDWVYFSSRDSFEGFLKQWLPYLRPLPSDLKAIFLTEVVDSYLKLSPMNERGEVLFLNRRLRVEAKKS